MSRRCLGWTLETFMWPLAAVIAVLLLAPVPVAGQDTTAAAPNAAADTVAFRTPWGDPDLQGI